MTTEEAVISSVIGSSLIGIIGLKGIIKTVDLYNVTYLMCECFIHYVMHYTTSLHAYLKISSVFKPGRRCLQ